MRYSKLMRGMKKSPANTTAAPLCAYERPDLADMGHRREAWSPELEDLVADEEAALVLCYLNQFPRRQTRHVVLLLSLRPRLSDGCQRTLGGNLLKEQNHTSSIGWHCSSKGKQTFVHTFDTA